MCALQLVAQCNFGRCKKVWGDRKPNDSIHAKIGTVPSGISGVRRCRAHIYVIYADDLLILCSSTFRERKKQDAEVKELPVRPKNRQKARTQKTGWEKALGSNNNMHIITIYLFLISGRSTAAVHASCMAAEPAANWVDPKRQVSG